MITTENTHPHFDTCSVVQQETDQPSIPSNQDEHAHSQTNEQSETKETTNTNYNDNDNDVDNDDDIDDNNTNNETEQFLNEIYRHLFFLDIPYISFGDLELQNYSIEVQKCNSLLKEFETKNGNNNNNNNNNKKNNNNKGDNSNNSFESKFTSHDGNLLSDENRKSAAIMLKLGITPAMPAPSSSSVPSYSPVSCTQNIDFQLYQFSDPFFVFLVAWVMYLNSWIKLFQYKQLKASYIQKSSSLSLATTNASNTTNASAMSTHNFKTGNINTNSSNANTNANGESDIQGVNIAENVEKMNVLAQEIKYLQNQSEYKLREALRIYELEEVKKEYVKIHIHLLLSRIIFDKLFLEFGSKEEAMSEKVFQEICRNIDEASKRISGILKGFPLDGASSSSSSSSSPMMSPLSHCSSSSSLSSPRITITIPTTTSVASPRIMAVTGKHSSISNSVNPLHKSIERLTSQETADVNSSTALRGRSSSDVADVGIAGEEEEEQSNGNNQMSSSRYSSSSTSDGNTVNQQRQQKQQQFKERFKKLEEGKDENSYHDKYYLFFTNALIVYHFGSFLKRWSAIRDSNRWEPLCEQSSDKLNKCIQLCNGLIDDVNKNQEMEQLNIVWSKHFAELKRCTLFKLGQLHLYWNKRSREHSYIYGGIGMLNVGATIASRVGKESASSPSSPLISGAFPQDSKRDKSSKTCCETWKTLCEILSVELETNYDPQMISEYMSASYYLGTAFLERSMMLIPAASIIQHLLQKSDYGILNAPLDEDLAFMKQGNAFDKQFKTQATERSLSIMTSKITPKGKQALPPSPSSFMSSPGNKMDSTINPIFDRKLERYNLTIVQERAKLVSDAISNLLNVIHCCEQNSQQPPLYLYHLLSLFYTEDASLISAQIPPHQITSTHTDSDDINVEKVKKVFRNSLDLLDKILDTDARDHMALVRKGEVFLLYARSLMENNQFGGCEADECFMNAIDCWRNCNEMYKDVLEPLIQMATSWRSQNIIYAGFGLKLGGVVKNWKERYFVLTLEHLAYYDNDKPTKKLKKTVATSFIKSVSESKDGVRQLPSKRQKEYPYCLEVIIPRRTFQICFKEEKSIKMWLQSIGYIVRLANRKRSRTLSKFQNRHLSVYNPIQKGEAKSKKIPQEDSQHTTNTPNATANPTTSPPEKTKSMMPSWVFSGPTSKCTDEDEI